MKFTYIIMTFLLLTGCKYYGSALPPDNPISMGKALSIATNRSMGEGGEERGITKKIMRPRIEAPSYVPEKELAVVSAPETILVWTYPRITDDNIREFGRWSTIFIKERYEWVKPSNEIAEDDMLIAK